MVDIIYKKVDFLLAVFTCLLLLPGKVLAQPDAEDYMVINRLSRENGLPDQDKPYFVYRKAQYELAGS